VTGNPVRDEIVDLAGDLRTTEQTVDGTIHVLVIGGSQGAHAINQAMIQALPRLGRQVRVVHQTGERDFDRVKQAYAEADIAAVVQPFFNDMAARYREADLIVCRAGATTVAEITVIGRAALFIPFPYAADDHQTRNAQVLVDAGAALMIAERDLNPEDLAAVIDGLAGDRRRLATMEANARALGRPNAAQEIVDDVYDLISGR
jgi:UDP-N-acetylglucosamine--N-acetylmuramyl-(pentapeptide) pyrophosphoryl-undecaprenol N-acetylglucosamine transferase